MALTPRRLPKETSLPVRPGAPRAHNAGRAVFDALYDALFPNVYAHAARHARDVAEAEALTTAAWEAIVLELPHRDPDENLGEWLFRIVRREVASRTRSADRSR
jgi:DNA-directed RNA polymerase specialized sigma24 family protein